MEDDGPLPRSASRSLSLDLARMSSWHLEQDVLVVASPKAAGDEPGGCPGASHLSAEALAMIRGQVTAERKELLYSNSLRRRSLEGGAK
ncbi:hypothetical protein MNEG_1004 [Monoraphidium neglectum]|uniref:Uncharacterized protein n=1 Tax=Monoraphidium neglectum TaxID=145388 RepID=A0A0D2K9M4_9CHLO|nr:hypothetical protein MNEG_1004 [Monoraphidium neglectum]KIZ06953.1 hypothetical protein MNEG_1004 [Monoraphidium neglectum]|eukprot:XP_013905972.1 hypothetical protein MNEG_1004 [Monoraphidium neglectum]